MALLLGWCGRENRNVWSELVFCSMARPDLRNIFRERGGVCDCPGWSSSAFRDLLARNPKIKLDIEP